MLQWKPALIAPRGRRWSLLVAVVSVSFTWGCVRATHLVLRPDVSCARRSRPAGLRRPRSSQSVSRSRSCPSAPAGRDGRCGQRLLRATPALDRRHRRRSADSSRRRRSRSASRFRSRASDAGGVSLAFVFAVAAIVLFGWAAGVLVAARGGRDHAARSAPPADSHRLQRRGARARRARGGRSIAPIPATSSAC